MLLTLPTVSLVLAGGLALLNTWLAVRVAQVRGREKVMVGDGGNERVIRRMRAHANFAENAPLLLALVLLIELSLGTSTWLWAAAAMILVARVLHPFGMDGWIPGRAIGTGATFLLQVALGLWAIAIPLTFHAPRIAPAVEAMPARG